MVCGETKPIIILVFQDMAAVVPSGFQIFRGGEEPLHKGKKLQWDCEVFRDVSVGIYLFIRVWLCCVCG